MLKSTKIITYLLFFSFIFSSVSASDETLSKARRWIRDNEFQFNALVYDATQKELYKDFGFTSIMLGNLERSGYPEKLAGFAVENGMQWHWFYRWNPERTDFFDSLKAYKEKYPGLIGVVVGDENNPDHFEELGRVIQQAREIEPDILYYHALYGVDMFDHQNDYKDFREYLRKAINVADVEVVQFNQYPFRRNGTAGDFFKCLAIVREEALKADKPYWNWLQAFGWINGPFDEPNDSQLALQAYTSLAYGFSGLTYWTFGSNYPPYTRSIVDAHGKISPAGKSIQQLLPEIKKIGNRLKDIDSTEVYYVPSKTDEISHISGAVKYFTPGCDTYIDSAEVSDAPYGFFIGLFMKDNAIPYLLVVNANHDYRKTSKETVSEISLNLSDKVDSVEFFNCDKDGFFLTESDKDGLLKITLDGGKGNLYRLILKD